jgi:hypothetical protein
VAPEVVKAPGNAAQADYQGQDRGGKGKDDRCRKDLIQTDAAGLEGDQFPVVAHPQKHQKDAQQTGHRDEHEQKKRAQKDEQPEDVQGGYLLVQKQLAQLKQPPDQKQGYQAGPGQEEKKADFLEDPFLEQGPAMRQVGGKVQSDWLSPRSAEGTSVRKNRSKKRPSLGPRLKRIPTSASNEAKERSG